LLSFATFRLDLDLERLWNHDREVQLRRKPFAILRLLVQNPKRLVTHAEIVEAVWGKTAMSESLLRNHVHDLRSVVGEGVVETVVGRGYRFTPEIQHIPTGEAKRGSSPSQDDSAKYVVGRESELDALHSALRSACDRKRTTVFVTGEAGVGKTTLVDVFVEQASEHPFAGAVVKAAEERKIKFSKVENFKSHTGKGVEGLIENRRIVIGSLKLLEELGINAKTAASAMDQIPNGASSLLYLAVDGEAQGIFQIADPIKSTTPEAIQSLKKAGIQIVMVTGDNRKTGEAIARRLNIDEVKAEVLPQDKAEEVKKLRKMGRTVAVAGDGINDAPALAEAQVGIAMGTGTDVAMEGAGITLVRGDLRGIVKAIQLSRATMKNIRQNLFFAFIYNTLGIPIAAGLLYPFTKTLLNPAIAAAAMSFSSVSVIMNALRLKNLKL